MKIKTTYKNIEASLDSSQRLKLEDILDQVQGDLGDFRLKDVLQVFSYCIKINKLSPEYRQYLNLFYFGKYKNTMWLFECLECDDNHVNSLEQPFFNTLYRNSKNGAISLPHVANILELAKHKVPSPNWIDWLLLSIVPLPGEHHLDIFKLALDHVVGPMEWMPKVWEKLSETEWESTSSFTSYFKPLYVKHAQYLTRYYCGSKSLKFKYSLAAFIYDNLSVLELVANSSNLPQIESTQIGNIEGSVIYCRRLIVAIEYFLYIDNFDYWKPLGPASVVLQNLVAKTLNKLDENPLDYFCAFEMPYLIQFWLGTNPTSFLIPEHVTDPVIAAILLRYFKLEAVDPNTEYSESVKYLIKSITARQNNPHAPITIYLPSAPHLSESELALYKSDMDSYNEKLINLENEVEHYLSLLRSMAFLLFDIPFHVSRISTSTLDQQDILDESFLHDIVKFWCQCLPTTPTVEFIIHIDWPAEMMLELNLLQNLDIGHDVKDLVD